MRKQYDDFTQLKLKDMSKSISDMTYKYINPETQVEEIYDYLPYIHFVLVMTVVPGRGGQSLIEETLDKINILKKHCEENNIDIDIEADGGINGDNAQQVRDAGANVLVSGVYIINSQNLREAVDTIRGQ